MEEKQIHIVEIKPYTGWQGVDFKELKEYRDLFVYLVLRSIKVIYAQTIMGFSWAIVSPLAQILVFTVIFGKVAKLPTEGIPYFLFSTLAIIPWTYMSTALEGSSSSLVTQQNLLGKVYIPRLIFPLVPIFAKLVDFLISLIILFAVLLYYRITPGWNLIYLPIFLLMMIIVPSAFGMWLSALAIRYRDVKFALAFLTKLLIYSAPILYSAEKIPETYRIVYSLNPIVGVIEGFRATLLGTPMPWLYIIPGILTSLIILVFGALYFRRMERVFVDVI